MSSSRLSPLAALLVAAPVAAQTAPAPNAPNPAPASPVTFFGEIRSRSEYDRPNGGTAADAFTALRSRFGARADAGSGLSILLQVQDSRVLGAEASTTAPIADALDLHQGYADLGRPLGGVRASLRAGRQEIALGNERLVGAANWTATGRAFDGGRVTFAPRAAKPGAEPWTVSAFAATVEERGRRAATTTTTATAATTGTPDHAAVGLFATRALGAAALDATVLYDRGGKYRSYDGADRTTVDVRARQARGSLVTAELEAAYQLGSQRYVTTTASHGQSVRAWLVGARLGTPAALTSGGVTLGVDVLSGDASPADGTYGAFNTMYATNHGFYGFMDLFSDPAGRTKERGLVDAKALGALAVTPSLRPRAEVHHFSLAAGGGRDLGWEADLVAPVRLAPNAGLDLGVSAFRAGPAAALAGLGADGTFRQWAYLQLRVGF